ncbi:MAG: GDP-mannose 4,6-dehydratase [Planctomycetaceae bacterium]|nr:GDP-mannose 4,6-dehydratase [Planctomycetaceae bacterium]
MSSTFQAKRVLITGGAGFIGSHLAEYLLARGAMVTLVDDLSTGSMDNISGLISNPKVRWVPGTVSDRRLVAELVSQTDVVFHLAAAVGVALIAKQPIQTIERNVEPTQFLLAELSRHHELGRSIPVFIASTSEVYGKNPKPFWCEEDDLVYGSTAKARWSYGVSKAIDEFLALGHYRASRLPAVVGRFFNVVGPRQTGAYGMVLPRFVHAGLTGKPLLVHDDGQQIRCFSHVLDVVEAICQLMVTESAAGRVFNIGADRPVSILELAQMVIGRTGNKSAVEFQSYRAAYDDDFEDIRRRVPDLSRLKSTINYAPKFDLEDIIDDVVRWARPVSI